MIFLFYDLTDSQSLQDCKMYLEQVERYSDGRAVLVAAGTKCDGVDNRVVSQQMMDEFFSQNYHPIPTFEVSAKTGQGVNDLFFSTAEMCLEKIESGSFFSTSNMNDNVERERVQQRSKPKSTEVKEKDCIIC